MVKSPLAVLVIVLSLATQARADVTTIRQFRLGEADNVSAGTVATNTDNNLVIYGAPLYSADTPNADSTLCIDFDGSTQYGSAGNAANLTNNFGLEAWVKPAVATGGEHIVVYSGDTAGSGWGIFQDPATGKFSALFGGRVIFGEGTVTPGEWTHLAFVCTDSNATFYVNGVPSGPSVAQLPAPPGTNLSIGASLVVPAASFFQGKIDEVRLFTFAPGAFIPADLLYTATPRPILNVSRQGSQTTLTWPTAHFAFSLESSTNISSGWLPLLHPVSTNGNFSLTQSLTDTTRFYRLKTPCGVNAPPTLPPGSYIRMTRDEDQLTHDVLPGSYADSEVNYISNSDPVTFDATAFMDPADCDNTPGNLTFHWEITYPAVAGITNPYSVAGITGYRTALLRVGANTLIAQIVPPVDFKLIVTSAKTGLSTTVDILSQVSESSLTLTVFNSCKGQATACPTCICKNPAALPTNEPN